MDTATEKPKRDPRIEAELKAGTGAGRRKRTSPASANGTPDEHRDTSLSSVDPGEDTVTFMGVEHTFRKMDFYDWRELEREGYTLRDISEGVLMGKMTMGVIPLLWVHVRRTLPNATLNDVFDAVVESTEEDGEKLGELVVKHSRLFPDSPNRTGANATETETTTLAPSTGNSSLAN